MEYKFLLNQDTTFLEKLISEHLQNGWKLYGDPFTGTTETFQREAPREQSITVSTPVIIQAVIRKESFE